MPFSVARAAHVDILSIVRCDDLLAGVGMFQHRFAVWVEPVEKVVEQPGGKEGVDVADGEAVKVEWSA